MGNVTRVALVGFGMAGRVFHAPLVSATQGLALHTVVSSDPERVLAVYPDVQVCADPADAFANPEIGLVVIATPNDTHAPLAMAALAHGKHVVVDKPFALNVRQARQVVDAAQAAQRLVSVFHNRRWDSDFLTLRALLDAGVLGQVAEFHSHFDRYRPGVADRWRERNEPGAGAWFDLGPHLLDQALQLFGWPDAVMADLAAQREKACVDDYFHVVLKYPRHRVILHGGALVAASSLRFAVHGTRASFVKHGLDAQEAALKDGAAPGVEGWGSDPRPGQLHAPGDASMDVVAVESVPGDYLQYYRSMREAILGRGAAPVTVGEALRVMHLLELSRESARSGRELSAPNPAP